MPSYENHCYRPHVIIQTRYKKALACGIKTTGHSCTTSTPRAAIIQHTCMMRGWIKGSTACIILWHTHLTLYICTACFYTKVNSPTHCGPSLQAKVSVVESRIQVRTVEPIALYPWAHTASHDCPSSLVHGKTTKPFSGGSSSGQVGGSHMAGLSLHMREGRQVRLSPPLRVNPSSQVKLQAPPTVCLSQSMVPLGGASSVGSQLRAEKDKIECSLKSSKLL